MFRFEYVNKKELPGQTIAYNSFLDEIEAEKDESDKTKLKRVDISEEDKNKIEPEPKKSRIDEETESENDCVKQKPSKKDEYEETLTCPICTELMYDCVR